MREKSDSKEKEGEKKEEKKSNSTADVTLEKKAPPNLVVTAHGQTLVH